MRVNSDRLSHTKKSALLRRVASSSLCSPQDRSGRLDRALSALRTLHDEYGPALRRVREARELHAACSASTFVPGTVIRHARFKYRGVIYGWDPVCERDAVWCAAAGVRPDQPFYYVLPDEGDSLRLLGGVRISKYVAHENVVPLSLTADPGDQPPPNRLKHRALDHYFDGYSPRQGAYVPNKRLRYEVRGRRKGGGGGGLRLGDLCGASKLCRHYWRAAARSLPKLMHCAQHARFPQYPGEYSSVLASREPMGDDSNILVGLDDDGHDLGAERPSAAVEQTGSDESKP